MLETAVGPLDQGTASAKQVEKLLRVMGAAFGPETAANTTGHNGHIIILDAHFKLKVKSQK
jgi:hypothetical protein